MSQQIDVLITLNHTVVGRAIFWGDTVDSNTTPADDSKVWALHNSGSDAYATRSRCLMKFPLSAIPRNSYIQSASLRLCAIHYQGTNPAQFDMAIYPCEVTPWDATATMQYYAGSNAWQRYGLEPNKDYLGAYLAKKTVSPAICPDNSWHEFDVTAFIRTVIDRDDGNALMIIKPEDAWEHANTLVHVGDGQATLPFSGTGESNLNKRAMLRIVYTEPLAFFASQADGTIDLGREIFLGVGQMRIGSVVHSATEIAYQESPAKLWLKNQLSSMSMKSVEVESPANWATYPEPNAANTGNGSSSDVSTSPMLTIDEQWEIRLTSATAFGVYRDTGTGDDPAQEQVWTQDGTGTVGTLYSSATRGIAFTVTAGGAAFVSGDKFTFRTYQDKSIVGASADADYLLQICKDSAGSPDGNWYHARPAMTTLTQQVVSSNLLNVALAKYFNPSNKIKIFKHATRTWTSQYTIQSVNKTTNTITLVESISAEIGDWVHAIRLNAGDILAAGTFALWTRGLSFTDTVKEEKYQYLRAKEAI